MIGTCQICDRREEPLRPIHLGDRSSLLVCSRCLKLEWSEPGDGLTGDGEPRMERKARMPE